MKKKLIKTPLKIYPLEKFIQLKLDDRMKKYYAISNYGRLVSFTDKLETGTLVQGSLNDGYPWFRYVRFDAKKRSYHGQSFHRLVAENFLPEPRAEQIHVLHLDFNRQNNNVSNLKWASRQEKIEHHRTSPFVINAKKNLVSFNVKRDGNKLKVIDVIRIKKMIFNPNRKTRLKLIAKQFGISEMQLYRIKRGENWGHIKVEVQPEKNKNTKETLS